jgi:uncharacterized protein YegL
MTKENLTAIAVIIDQSGSMASLQKDIIGGYNTFLKEQKAVSGEATLTLTLFSDHTTIVHDNLPLSEVPELTEATYRPSGSTALLDAIGKTVDTMGRKFASMKEEDRPSKVIVLIMTDGEENASTAYKHAQIKEMVSHQQDKYNWQFVFVGANIDSFSVGTSFGVAAHSTYSYTANSIGTKSLYSSISSGTTAFRNSAVGTSFNMVDPNAAMQGANVSPVVNGVMPPTVSGQTVSASNTKTDDDKQA